MTTRIAYILVKKNPLTSKDLGEKMSTDQASRYDFFAPSFKTCTSRVNIQICLNASDR